MFIYENIDVIIFEKSLEEIFIFNTYSIEVLQIYDIL